MKQNTLIKQAYVRGLAARGLLRQYIMQKQAAEIKDPNLADQVGKVIDQADNKNSWKDWAMYGGIGAGSGAAIGALIQALRKKNILLGAGIGGGIGGSLGLGARAALNTLNQSGVLSKERLQKGKDAVHKWVDPKEEKALRYLNDSKNQDMVKNIALAGGVGAAGGGIIGALIQAARQKNILLGAGIGAGVGGIGGIGVGAAPYITDFSKKQYAKHKKKKEEEEKTRKNNEEAAKLHRQMQAYQRKVEQAEELQKQIDGLPLAAMNDPVEFQKHQTIYNTGFNDPIGPPPSWHGPAGGSNTNE